MKKPGLHEDALLSFAEAREQPKAAKAEKTDENKRLNVHLSPELHKKIKIIAASKGISLKEMIEGWIQSMEDPKR